MVKGDGLHDEIGQPPKAQNVGTDFGMADPEFAPFDFDQRRLLLRCPEQSSTIFLREVGNEHQFADVVKHTRDESVTDKMLIAAFLFV